MGCNLYKSENCIFFLHVLVILWVLACLLQNIENYQKNEQWNVNNAKPPRPEHNIKLQFPLLATF